MTDRQYTQEQSQAMYEFIMDCRSIPHRSQVGLDELYQQAMAITDAIASTPQPDTNQGARYVVEGDFRGMFTIRDLDDYSFRDTEYTDEADAQAACDRLNASTPEAGSGNGGS